MNRAQALHGLDQRIGALLLARTDPPLTGVPIRSPVMPMVAISPGETGTRVCRAMSLTIPPGVDVFALFANDWQRAGFQPRSWSSPAGPIVVATDQAGFVLVLQIRTGQVELSVISPPLSSARNPGLSIGLAVGAVIGFVGPCFSLAAFLPVRNDQLAMLAFVPIILVLGGGLLIWPNTRQVGLGLLIGGAVTGIVTAGVCATMLT